ncbi:arylsulfatase [Halomonas sp. H33-56]|uniref:arylsulfatase n=1 Tax=Halomonas sp. H33-56 TaxID=2950873 RepID=UPI0032DFEFB6
MRTSIAATMLTVALSAGLLAAKAPIAMASTLSRAVAENDHRQPAIPHPQQQAAAAQALADFEARAGQKPNILLFIVDDLGYGDPGAFGGGEAVGAPTPHMDRLADEGLMLTSTYSQYTCTPTRAAIFTGRLPVRTGLIRPILAGDSVSVNPWEGETSIARLLSNQGYYSLLVGKWHIGEEEGMRPHDVGFDEFYGYYRAQKEYTQRFDERRYPDLVLDDDKLERYDRIKADDNLIHGLADGTTEVVSQVSSIEDMAEGDARLRDYTVDSIQRLSQQDAPFFITHAFMKVHADNWPSEAFRGASPSKYPYKDAVVEVDSYIGDIVQALEDSGELENTFIFVTSDNGPQMDSWPDSGYTPFRGAKGTTWEGGVRVPGIAYWKGMIPPGQRSDGLFDLMDLFNTFATLGGAEDGIPQDRYIDGIDQTSFLLTENGQSHREQVYMWLGNQFTALRMREYKMHTAVVRADDGLRWIDMATVERTALAPWLFNLYIDPKEQMTVGHRRNAWQASMVAEAGAHRATFEKFPAKNIGLE